MAPIHRKRAHRPRRSAATLATVVGLTFIVPASASACGKTPRDAVARYYHAVNAKQYKRAWSCLRTATRTAFGGYAKWKAGYSRTRYTHIRWLETTDQGAGLGHVRFTISTCRSNRNDVVIERVSGRWFAQDGSAGWRIGEPKARVTRSDAKPSC